jgi:hypothetical protein
MTEKNHKTGHVTETPDVSYIKNVDVTHEVSDVYISGIAKFVVGLSILMIASFLLMWAIFDAFERRVEEPKRSPMALAGNERLPPEPRLQGAPGFGEGLEKTAPQSKTEGSATVAEGSDQPKSPVWEIKAVRDQWNDVLANGPLDKDGKRYGMPIERAKEEILKQGLPARSQTADGRSQTADSRRQ